jgi:putative ATPase
MQPLAERMRPQNFNDMVGQSHLISKGSILNNLLESGHIPSMIFWGPPGCGKTTLCRILARHLSREFFSLSAVNSGVKDLRELFENIKKTSLFSDKNPVLFIDELHRFSKSQQDSLLHEVEKGTVTLFGATTENPSFEIIGPLLSRCQVFILTPVSNEDLMELFNRATLKDKVLSFKKITIKETEALVEFSTGDARKALNNLEMVVNYLEGQKIENDTIEITNEAVEKCLQQKTIRYDKSGEEHFNIISAFIKSIRGSDPNAAVYWLARMIETGEKPEFIARRMLILASEDIGLANPTALMVANSSFDAVHKIGWPESRIILANCAIYLAVSAKSNSAYMAINSAQEEVKKSGYKPVPIHLRNPVTPFMKNLDYGKNYKYAHDFKNNFARQKFLPDDMENLAFYVPGENARENEIKDILIKKWKDHYSYE